MSHSELDSRRSVVRAAAIRVPDHIVHRSFVAETVVLNLETGKYHGLNQTGGRMLEALKELGTVPAATEMLAGEFEVPTDQLDQDICDFCLDLAERGLIQIDGA